MGAILQGPVVFDALPLVALVFDEPLADAVELRMRTLGRRNEGLISSVNWCEVLYVIERRAGAAVAAQASSRFDAAGILVVDVGKSLASSAAALKASYRLGIGDAFAAALALTADAPLVTADTDFLPLVDGGLKLDWLGE